MPQLDIVKRIKKKLTIDFDLSVQKWRSNSNKSAHWHQPFKIQTNFNCIRIEYDTWIEWQYWAALSLLMVNRTKYLRFKWISTSCALRFFLSLVVGLSIWISSIWCVYSPYLLIRLYNDSHFRNRHSSQTNIQHFEWRTIFHLALNYRAKCNTKRQTDYISIIMQTHNCVCTNVPISQSRWNENKYESESESEAIPYDMEYGIIKSVTVRIIMFNAYLPHAPSYDGHLILLPPTNSRK